MRRQLTALLTVTLVSSSVLAAQTASPVAPEAPATLTVERARAACAITVEALEAKIAESRPPTRKEVAENTATLAVSESGVQSPAVAIIATTEDKQAVARLGLQEGRLLLSGTLTTPFDGKAPTRRDPLNIHGLSNGTSATVGLQFMDRRPPRIADIRSVATACANEGMSLCDCQTDKMRSESNRDVYDSGIEYAPQTRFMFGIAGGFSRNEFTWFDSTALSRDSDSETDVRWTGMLGWYMPRRGFLAVRYEEKKVFTAGDIRSLCQPLGTDTPYSTCEEIAIGAPSKKIHRIGRLEWRRFFNGSSIAVNPIISYDFTETRTAIDLPIYFIQDSSGLGLNGGVSIGWKSDSNNIEATLFISAALPRFGF